MFLVRPCQDLRGFDLISDAPPFRWLWYAEPDAISEGGLWQKHEVALV